MVVARATGSATFGPASAMSYDMFVNSPTAPGVYPKMPILSPRWPDTIDCVPFKPGDVLLVGSVDGELQLMGTCGERPYVQPCAAGLQTPSSFLQDFLNLPAPQKAALAAELKRWL